MNRMINTDAAVPRVTVVTVVRNAASAIEGTIQSVLSQDYPAIEYIVIDGLSTDGTLDVIERYRDRIAQLRSEGDAGIYDAMNKGASLATGDWIIFMNAGDSFYASDTLSRLLPELHGGADVICGATEEVLVDEIETRRFHVAPRSPQNLWRHMPTNHQAILVRREVQQHYQFDTSYQWCADHDLLARLHRDGKTFALVAQILCVYDCAGGRARDPRIYIRERWRLSRGLASLPRRIQQYGGEWLHCTVWGRVTAWLKTVLPSSILRSLRRLRGTSGAATCV
jgi:glycosyltransferase involved in cell wall biosynthesis